MLKVEILRYTPDGEKLIAAAAKLCYSSVGINEIEENVNENNTDKFLQLLIDLNHESPIEHISFTFGVEGISRTLSHQLVRHRIASFSQQSQRYVKLEQFEYIMPPAITNNKVAKALFEQAMEEDQKYYDKITNILFEQHYKRYIELGFIEKEAKSKAEKESIEDSRYVFPNACETKMVFTMNARSLLNFFRLRCCNRAQWEIRELAIEMLKKVKVIYPNLFKSAGPGCIINPCPEGKMTCGKIVEVRENFNNLI